MPANLALRNGLYYAVLTIPADVRRRLDKGLRFVRSLQTSDRRIAGIRAAPIVAKWKTEILTTRLQVKREHGVNDPILAEALRWRTDWQEGSIKVAGNEAEEDDYASLVTDRAEQIEAKDGLPAAQRFARIALGNDTPTAAKLDAFMASKEHLAQKTRDQMAKDVALMVQRFPALQDITHQNVKRWLDELSQGNVGASSQERITSFCRGYWSYLQSIDAVPTESRPFANLAPLIARTRPKGKRSKPSGWLPFAPADVVALHHAAMVAEDTQLADLITLAAYSGARIEELCALKLDHMTPQAFKIVDAKTSAGIREVPIHSKLRPLVKRARAESKDGYLLSGLTFNKYGDRSNAIGKRFGRLKAAHGYGEQHVFHSIRKTVVTLLENAGVSENLAADIVGHEKPRITYGLYSGGAALAVKAKALEAIRYSGW